jgi:type II secretion system protein N
MAPTRKREAGELPRPLLAIGVPCAGVLLIAFFLIRDFPYDLLGARVVRRIEHSQGAHLAIGELTPVMQLAGPALVATGVRATLSNGDLFQIDRALLRAAWSTSWLMGDPAVHLELEGPMGSAVGTLHWNGSTAWKGTASDVAVSLPPVADLIPVVRLGGALDATIDVEIGELGSEGLIDFAVRDGSLSLPNIAVPLPFELFSGKLALGGDEFLTLESMKLEGAAVSGTGSGTIARAETFEQAPVSLEFELSIDAALSKKLRAAGIRVNRNGLTPVQVSGTVALPTTR